MTIDPYDSLFAHKPEPEQAAMLLKRMHKYDDQRQKYAEGTSERELSDKMYHSALRRLEAWTQEPDDAAGVQRRRALAGLPPLDYVNVYPLPEDWRSRSEQEIATLLRTRMDKLYAQYQAQADELRQAGLDEVGRTDPAYWLYYEAQEACASWAHEVGWGIEMRNRMDMMGIW